jgi:hypothetical protein
MKRVLLLACLLAMTGTALAGFSIGFNQTKIPTNVYDVVGGDIWVEDIYMLRLGAMFSPEFRVEGYIGYMKESFEEDPPAITPVEYEGSGMVFGAGGYYVIEAPANTSFSFGARFLYGSVNMESGINQAETKSWCLDPLMRIDFAIPGAEQLAFFTEYGFRYANATSTYTSGGTQSPTENKWTGFQTYAPSNIIAGAYYVF